MFTHRHTFGETGGDQPISQKLASQCLQYLKTEFPQFFAEPKFPITRDNLVHFKHRFRLKDKGDPLPHHKTYPFDQKELVELKKQIIDMLSKNQIKPSESPYSAPTLFANKRMAALDSVQIIGQ